MKNPWVVFGGVAVLAIVAAIFYSQQIGKQANEGVTLSPHIKGNEAATVKLTEYSDFQCPACGQFYPVVKEVVDQYKDQLTFEYKHFPLISIHPNAAPAAKAAEAAAQQGKFWEMHDKLFENQAAWSGSSAPQPIFIGYAKELGLNVDQFTRQMKASLIADKVADSFREARERGLTGTPTFFLNDEMMQFQTIAEFKAQIEQALGVSPAASASTTSPTPAVQFGI